MGIWMSGLLHLKMHSFDHKQGSRATSVSLEPNIKSPRLGKIQCVTELVLY